MKFKIIGSHDHAMSGVPQIIEALKKLGHEIVDSDADVLYHPTGFFEDLFEAVPANPRALKVGCLLDANPLNPDWPEEKVALQLSNLDIALTISETARQQILKRTGQDTKVVYYPIKPIVSKNYMRGVDFLTVGRIYSENKRFNLVDAFLKAVSFNRDLLIVAGPEKPPFGYYTGLLPTETLNELYNSAKYLLFFSSHEGLGLSAIEAIVAGCTPILCSDNECVKELGLEDFSADPNPISLASKLKEMEENRSVFLEKINILRGKFLAQFSAEAVAKNILDAILNK